MKIAWESQKLPTQNSSPENCVATGKHRSHNQRIEMLIQVRAGTGAPAGRGPWPG